MVEQGLPSEQEGARRRPVGAESSPGGVGSPLGSEALETQALPALDALLQTNFMEVLPSVKGLKDLQPHAESHEPFGDDRVLAFGPLYLHDLQYDEYIEAGMADADGNTVLFTIGAYNAALSFGLSRARNVTDRAGAFLNHFNANLWDPVFMHIAKSHTGTPGVQPDMDSSFVSRLDLIEHDITGLRRLEFHDTDQAAGNNISLQQRGDAAGAILEIVNSNDATQYSSPTYRRLRLADPVGADDAATKRYVDGLSYAGHNLLDGSLHGDTLAAGVTDGSIIIGNVTPKWSKLVISIPAANVRNVLGVDNGELRPSWKAALDATNPVNAGGAAAPGTSLIFSHRDHVHAVAASHSGSAHHAALTIGADAAHSLAAQVLSAVLAANGQTGHMSGAMFDKLAGIEATADVTDAANVAGAGAVMDSDISPGEGFLRKTGAGTYTAHKSNLATAAAPDANEDSADGYSVGSLWIDTTNDNMYVCVDATEAAAVWLHLNAAAAAHDHTVADGSGVLTNDEHDGYSEYVEIAAPGAGAANKLRLYSKDDGAGVTSLAFVDSAGVETLIKARTRVVPLSTLSATRHAGGDLQWNDGVTDTIRFGGVIPEDYVTGTDVYVQCFMHQTVTAGDPLALFNSYISCQADQEVFAFNIENAASVGIPLTINTNELFSRTLGSADVAVGDRIAWALVRLGADNDDAVNAAVKCIRGAWVKYTAFF